MSKLRIPPTDQFAADIRQLADDLEEYKKYQRSGEDSIRMYRVFSDAVADKTLTTVLFNNKKFRLTFTPDAGPEQGLVYKMRYTLIGDAVAFVERESEIGDDGSQSWLFVVSGSDFFPAALVELKFYFWASGTGTFSVTDL